MADETPEQVRERVHAEELAKGSDPRVAEGRAKAAEMRARHGLPIDPKEAGRALMAEEGRTPSPPEAPTPSPPEAPTPSPPEAPTPSPPEAPTPSPPEAPTPSPPEAPTPSPPEAPTPSPPEAPTPSPPEAPTPQPPPARPPAVPQVFEPEVGAPIEVGDEVFDEIAGIQIRDARLPRWLIASLLAVLAWALLYIAMFSGADAVERASHCRMEPDRTLVCFEGVSKP